MSEQGRVHESSVMASKTVLSTLLSHPEKIIECDVDPMMMASTVDGIILGTMFEMSNAKEAVDIITIAEKLESKTGNSNLAYMTDMVTESSGSSANFKAYCSVVKDRYRKLKAIEVAKIITERIDTDGVIEAAIRDLMQLTSEDKNYEYSLTEAMKIGIEDIDYAFKNKGQIRGLSTGLTELDFTLGGFHKTDLIIIGARPAMGKTAAILNMILRAGEKVGFISSEQGVNQIIQRMMAISGGVSLSKMRTGNLMEADWSYLEAAGSKIKKHPGAWIYDKPSPTIDEIESLARRWVYEFDVKGLYIDYLQRLSVPHGKTKTESVSQNISRLKNLARELDIPVVVLAQVKRDVETRKDRRPSMGDISDSSETEKEADVIIMMYRDEYYHQDTDYPNTIEFLIEKQRHGPCGAVYTKWEPQFLRISDMNEGRRGNN